MSDEANATAAEQALADAISGPKRVRGDAGEVEQHDLDDLIAAEKHQKAKQGGASSGRGIRFTQLKPPGAV